MMLEEKRKKTDAQWEGRFVIQRTEDGEIIFLLSELTAAGAPGTESDIPGITAEIPVVFTGMPAARRTAPEVPAAADTVLFAKYAEEWLENLRYQVKESTYVKYWNQLHSYIIPGLGSWERSALSREVIERFCSELLSAGGEKKKGLSPKTVSDIMSVVRGIFRYASEHGAKETFNISTITVKKEQKEMKVLRKEDQKRLYRYLLTHPTPRNLGILICLLMGLRLGEVCALKWGNISFSDQTLSVQYTIQRVQTKDNPERKTKIIITSPKSASSVRSIPIPRELMKLLLILKKNPDCYILTGSPDSFVEPRTMERYFEKVLKELGIDHVNFHALRHTFATNCVEMGFDVKSLSVILGHSNVSITMNRYVHPTMEMKRNNMQKLSAFMENGWECRAPSDPLS